MYPNVPPPPTPPQPPRKRRTWPIVLVSLLGALFLGMVSCTAIVATSDPSDHAAVTATSEQPSIQPTESTDQPTEEATTEPTVEASPDGTFTGSCDYDLFPDVLFGEVDVENTGNVGILVDVKISWPQLGYDPIKMHRQVKVGYGQTKTVRFHRSANTNEIDRLQSWQENHGFADGCKYHGSMVDTYGQVH